MDEEGGKRTAHLFNRDISDIPCFRNSFLYGIGGGICSGLGYFLFSSNPRMSTHVAFSGFFTITTGFWFYCRYVWSQQKFAYGQLQFLMKKRVLEEGTELDKNFKDVTNEA